MQTLKGFMAVLLMGGLAGVSVLHGQNVTWKGGGATTHWNVPENWVGDVAPAVNNGGTATFPAAAHNVTSIVEANRTVQQLDVGASGVTVTHTIDLGGNMLTVTNLVRAGQWSLSTIDTVIFTNGTLRLGAAGAPAILQSQRGLINFNRQGTWMETVNLANIRLLDGAHGGATLDLRNVKLVNDLLQTGQIAATGRTSYIHVNDSLTGSTFRVTGTLSLLPVLGNSHIGDPLDPISLGGNNLGRFPADVDIVLGVDADNRGNAYIGRASPHGVVRCALAVAPGGGGALSAYLNNLHIGYSGGNAHPTHGLLDVATMDACTLDVLNLWLGTDRPSPNQVDNFNGTLRLGPGTATVANAVIGGGTSGFGTLSISNTTFAVTNSLTLHPSARLQIATGAESKGVDVSSAFNLAGSGVEIDVRFLEQTAADTTNWAIRVAGDHVTAFNSMIGTDRLTWELDPAITERKAGVVADATYTYFAMVDASIVFEPVAIAQDTTFEWETGGTVWIHVSEVDNGSFDPEGGTVQLRLIYDGGSPSESLSFASNGSYPVTLQVTIFDGEDVVATATDTATIHVVAPATGTQDDVEWYGEADTVLNTDRREWFWSGNWSGGEPPANPTAGTVFLRTFGEAFTGRLGADRTVGRLNAPSGGRTHTVDLGGNRLTVTDSLRAGSSQNTFSYLYVTNGIVQVGTDTEAASMYAVMATLSLNRAGVSLETRNISSITTENAAWGGANLDLRGVQFVGNELRSQNIHEYGRSVRGIMLDASAAGTTIRVPGNLRLWMNAGNGSSCLGDPDDAYSLGGGNLWRLPAGVSLSLGTDANTRGTLEVARATPHGTVRGGIVASAVGGGTLTAFLSDARIGYSSGGDTAAYGILDVATMDSCEVDILNLYIGIDRPSALTTDNMNGTLRLGPGTATIGSAVVGGIGAGQALWQTSNTVCSVTNSLVLNKTAALVINVVDEAGGIDLTNADPGALAIDGAATITVRFLEPPSHGSLHYGLRLAGDRMTELTDMGGNLVIDSSGLSRPAAFFLHQGDTYVGIPPPPGSLFLLR